jgi:Na+/H+ antiporter NhaD/arsenite permease-like protein
MGHEALTIKSLLSIMIFAVAYIFIATDKIHKTIVAILGAAVVLFLKLVTFDQAIGAVDFNVIFLLVGMMTSVFVLSKTGFFEWTAISLAKHARGNPFLIMLWLLSVTALLSAFLDNVTTIVLLVPVTILIMQLLEISPVPFVILEAIASNIGGTATLIGDPPNIVVGSQAKLSFMDFLIHMTPAVLLVFAAFLLTVTVIYRKSFRVPESVKRRVSDAVPHLAIVDRRNMIKALVVLGFIFLGFFLHEVIEIEPGIIALSGSMVMMMVCRSKSEETLMEVEWGAIFFFIGMFMMISALEVNGVIAWIGESILHLAGNNLFLVCVIVLWGSALFSAILDNIPFVITMVPLIRHFINHFSDGAAAAAATVPPQHSPVSALWWALALGACLGGNGTLIGASANIVMSQISARNKYPISFVHFMKYGLPFMVQAMVICTFYLWLRYF